MGMGTAPRKHGSPESAPGEEIARDLIDQAGILRGHSDGRQWITNNYAYHKGLPAVVKPSAGTDAWSGWHWHGGGSGR